MTRNTGQNLEKGEREEQSTAEVFDSMEGVSLALALTVLRLGFMIPGVNFTPVIAILKMQ